MNKILIVSAIILGLIITSCKSTQKEDNDSDEDQDKKELTRKLIIEDYDFAILENKKFIPYNKAIYHRGDEVFMVLKKCWTVCQRY